jgi:nicotinamidase-related amidase
MTAGLLLIDIQLDYFDGGAYPLPGAEAAAAAAAVVLAGFRRAGLPVLHLQHVAADADATFFLPDTGGIAIHPKVAPIQGEAVLVKAEPNGFIGTGLNDELAARSIDQLTVAGMMTSMCVDATVRAGLDLELSMTVVHDACAAPELEFEGMVVDAASVHTAFIAALIDAGAATIRAAQLALITD